MIFNIFVVVWLEFFHYSYFIFLKNFFKSCYYLSVLKYVFDVYFWNGLFLDTMMVNTKFVEESIICSCSTKTKTYKCCVEDNKNNYMVCLLNLMLTLTDFQMLPQMRYAYSSFYNFNLHLHRKLTVIWEMNQTALVSIDQYCILSYCCNVYPFEINLFLLGILNTNTEPFSSLSI